MSSPNLESLTNELSKFQAHLKRFFAETETPKDPPSPLWHSQQTPDGHPKGAPDRPSDRPPDGVYDGHLREYIDPLTRP